jgi:hypothetical protein
VLAVSQEVQANQSSPRIDVRVYLKSQGHACVNQELQGA